MMHWKKYLAELIGTCALTSIVLTSINTDLGLATPILAGLTLGIFVYTIGGISGAHINPAVTLGLLSVKEINFEEAVKYLVAQFAGAFIAYMKLNYLFGGDLIPMQPEDSLVIFGAEACGAFLLALGVSSVVWKKVEGAAAGLVIGGSLLIGIMMASSFSGGILNPAVAVGIRSISVSYLLGPIIGSVAGFWLYRWMMRHP